MTERIRILREYQWARRHHAFRQDLQVDPAPYPAADMPDYARTARRLSLALSLERPVLLPGELIAGTRTVPALPGIYGVRGAYAGSTFVLEADRPMTLGRDPAAAQIVFGQAAGKVSGAHCTVTYVASEDRYRVVDLSSNGTYVGSSRLPARTPVLVNRGAELMLADADNVVRLL